MLRKVGTCFPSSTEFAMKKSFTRSKYAEIGSADDFESSKRGSCHIESSDDPVTVHNPHC